MKKLLKRLKNLFQTKVIVQEEIQIHDLQLQDDPTQIKSQVEIGTLRYLRDKASQDLKNRLKFIEPYWKLNDADLIILTQEQLQELKSELSPYNIDFINKPYKPKPHIQTILGKLRALNKIAESEQLSNLQKKLDVLKHYWACNDTEAFTRTPHEYILLKAHLTSYELKILKQHLEN